MNPRVFGILGGSVVSLLAFGASAAAPFSASQSASLIRGTSATLNGMAVPNGEPTTAWFEWGTNSGYGQTSTPVELGDGFNVQRTSASLGGLTPGLVYEYRLVASNASGIKLGAGRSFATGKKLAAWGDSQSALATLPSGLTQTVAVACGASHSLAVDTGGAVIAWGDNTQGQTNVPVGLSNVIAVAGGWYHSLAVPAAGTVVGWGLNLYQQATPPPGLSNVIAVAAGYSHSLALKADGTVVCWGDNFFSQTSVPPGLSDVVAIACGDYHSLALKADGTVVGWGNSIFGQATVPVGLTGVIGIACGSSHSLALKADGTVVAWGFPITPPGGLGGSTSLAAGWVHDLALRSDRTVTGWGLDAAEIYTPPPGLVNVSAVTASSRHNLAIADNTPPTASAGSSLGLANTDLVVALNANDPNGDPLAFRVVTLPAAGTLFQFNTGLRGAPISSPGDWVTDPQGRLIFAPAAHANGLPYTTFTFLGSDGQYDSPVRTQTLYILPARLATTPASSISFTSASLNGAVLPNGEATSAWFEWGSLGAYSSATALTNVGAGSSLVRVQAGISGLTPGGVYQFRLAISNAASGLRFGARQLVTPGNRLAAWGSNSSGQTNFPARTTNAVALAAGGSHNLALLNNGRILAWGLNAYGQTNVPANASNVIAVAAGSTHSLALIADGQVLAWGRNTSGQTNVPPTLTNAVAVAAGGTHSLALRTDGTVVAWGNNSTGQTNVPGGLQNVVAIAAGLSNSFALRVDGSVVAWGGSGAGLLNIPSPATNVVALAAGNSHVVALREDGSVISWGTNNFGQASIPVGLSNVMTIAAGASHSLAVAADGSVIAWGLNNAGQTLVPGGAATTVGVAGGDLHSASLGNIPPTAPSQVAAGYVNHDLTLTLTGTDLNKDSLGFRLLSLPVQGALYQYSGGGRGALIGPGNTTVLDPEGRVVFAPAPGALGKSYALYVANDGVADSAPAFAEFQVALPVPPIFTQSALDPGRNLILDFVGSPEATYSVWASTNLTGWELLGPAAVVSDGAYRYVDLGATNWPWRFYRATAP